jgi:hypothetical protein
MNNRFGGMQSPRELNHPDVVDSAEYMRLPGEQRPVIHRELPIIRRISRERLHDRAQDSAIEGNLSLTNGDSA